jgi:hypothetical protein
MTKRILMTVAALLALANAANAASGRVTDRTERWDMSVQTRYTTSHDYDGANNTKLHLDDDLGWGFEFGYNMNEKINLGFLMSWRTISYNATYYDATDPTTQLNYGGWLDTGSLAAIGTWYILPRTVTPYINGNIGWTMVDTNIVADYYTGCWYDPWWGYICNGYTSTYGWDGLSYGGGVGLRFEPNEAVFFQVGYEVNWLDLNGADNFEMFRVDLGFTN